MNKKWTDYLSEEVYIRLCECRTIKADIPELVKCKWATMEYPCTKEDALIKGWWEDIKANCDEDFTSEDYDAFYNLMVKWIV